jgi:N-acetylmuramoyl-L-alanine amidase
MHDEWTTLAENDVPHNPDSTFLEYFTWEQAADELLRFRFKFRTSQLWGFRGWYEENTFKFAVRRPPVIDPESPFDNLIIALDAGHGGEHRGAVGATGYMEKDANLVYTLELAKLLRDAGARVVLTREADSTMWLKARADSARKYNAHLLVWLHNNSIGSTTDPLNVSGTSTYYTWLQGMPFALYVYPELLDLGLKPFGRVHRSYYITRQTDMVVFLVEGAFLSHPEDEIFLMNNENLKKLARAVFNGMEKYLNELASGI